jgi:hypothetical protein
VNTQSDTAAHAHAGATAPIPSARRGPPIAAGDGSKALGIRTVAKTTTQSTTPRDAHVKNQYGANPIEACALQELHEAKPPQSFREGPCNRHRIRHVLTRCRRDAGRCCVRAGHRMPSVVSRPGTAPDVPGRSIVAIFMS